MLLHGDIHRMGALPPLDGYVGSVGGDNPMDTVLSGAYTLLYRNSGASGSVVCGGSAPSPSLVDGGVMAAGGRRGVVVGGP